MVTPLWPCRCLRCEAARLGSRPVSSVPSYSFPYSQSRQLPLAVSTNAAGKLGLRVTATRRPAHAVLVQMSLAKKEIKRKSQSHVKGRERYLLPPARLNERRLRSAKTQKPNFRYLHVRSSTAHSEIYFADGKLDLRSSWLARSSPCRKPPPFCVSVRVN